jgi:hypothetical protein
MRISTFFSNFGAINANALYSILYFLKNNILFFIVILAIVYIVYIEIKEKSDEYIDDERDII